MKYSGLQRDNKWEISEYKYALEAEANIASLFTTGNGYIGIRGSLEEYGSLCIQGAYIRGLIDEVYELPQPLLDNEYMKKHYFNEDKLRRFEKHEKIVNFADFLLVRISIGGETFYPWEGKVLSWKRTLDIEHDRLIREVRWENSKGQRTKFGFERFSSFNDDHIYAIKVEITPENHSDKVEILSGIDCITKTNGQLICKAVSSIIDSNKVLYENRSGDKYAFKIATGVVSDIYCNDEKIECNWNPVDDGDIVAVKANINMNIGKTYILEKRIYVISARDTEENPKSVVENKMKELGRYDELYSCHCNKWKKIFDKIDIEIEGDDEADMALRFSNYHTAISLARNDHVHSLSAKGLTGEVYNDFVWWDCEVYQAPVFFQTIPEAAKNILLYRFDKLDAARKNAALEGKKGARYPFNSSVTGEEVVWAFTRHPFLQIHIVSDIAWGVCNYYLCTGDDQFMIDYGMEMLFEISRFWESRVEKTESKYVINYVTGTDEHHPEVDNNAYTNYSVYLVLKRTLELAKKFEKNLDDVKEKIRLNNEEVRKWREIVDNIYLPMDNSTGMIPQFDGYFSLTRDLEIAKGSSATSFQMKASGLYHKSQVIKQPDVLMLFSHLNFKFSKEVYLRNWNYYTVRCEESSSLSYASHAICSADLSLVESAYKYFMKTAALDLEDEHDCTSQGIHSACAAGAWLSIVRGIGGVIFHDSEVEIYPHMIPWWKSITFSFKWHGQTVHVKLNNENISLTASESNNKSVPINLCSEKTELKPSENIKRQITVNDTAFTVC